MAHLRVIHGVLDHLMVRLVEWATAIILLMFGLTLLQPGATFANPSYSVLASFAAEGTWGWIFASIGGARLLTLVLEGTFPWFLQWSLRLRCVAAAFSCFCWFALALGLFLANRASPGAKTYAALLVVDMITALYLGRQADRESHSLVAGSVARRL